MLSAFLLPSAFGWNNLGHMTVAAVAWDRLTPEARAEVRDLLRRNPQYKEWVAGVAPEERDRTAFLIAATWPDDIKGRRGYRRDSQSDAKAGRNIGYRDKLQHRYWHYIDRPFSPDGTALLPPSAPNAQTQIALFREALAAPGTSRALKSYDLVWLMHLVGDVHQPLHAASRFTRDHPEGDHGGNLVALCARPCRSELHGYWDEVLGSGKTPASAIRKAATLPEPNAKAAANLDEAVWIDESFRTAKQSVYAKPVGIGPGPFPLDAAYKANAKRVAAERIALAGARLAGMLNATLGR